MANARIVLGLVAILGILFIESCSSGKSAYEHGNYYQAVMTSVNKLRRNTDHKKSVETLRQAYPLAVKYFEDQANNSITSNAEFKWSSVVQSYASINSMYDEIKRSPGALAVIPNPVNYYGKLEEAKRNAAEENYQAGILALMTGNREKAKVAYRYFKTANEFVVGYKDVVKMMEKALWDATVKVLVTPIPTTKNVAWNAQFFDDKISEFLHGTPPINEFVKFYTYSEAQTLKLNPDHIVQLEFDEFVVGQVTLHEKQIQLEKDSIVVATYVTPNSSTVPATGAGVVSSGTGNNQTSGNNTNTTTPPNSNSNSNTNSNTNNSNTNTNTNTNSGNSNPNTNTNSGNSNTTTDTNNQNNTSNQNQNTSGSQNNQTNTGNQNQNTSNNQNNQANTGNQGNQNKPADKVEPDEEKVTICHKPPGNTENAKTLTVPRSALQAHLDHGDALGYCEDAKDKKNEDKKTEEKKTEEKKNDDKKTGKPGGSSMNYSPLRLTSDQPLLAAASADAWMESLLGNSVLDTTKVYAKVKATYYHYQKTTTSKGIVSFRILDAKTKAILTAEKMPGQYIWISEWATFNGDERALSPEQLQISQQKERVPPPPQDLFVEFTKPIYTQITTKIQNFYKGY